MHENLPPPYSYSRADAPELGCLDDRLEGRLLNPGFLPGKFLLCRKPEVQAAPSVGGLLATARSTSELHEFVLAFESERWPTGTHLFVADAHNAKQQSLPGGEVFWMVSVDDVVLVLVPKTPLRPRPEPTPMPGNGR